MGDWSGSNVSPNAEYANHIRIPKAQTNSRATMIPDFSQATWLQMKVYKLKSTSALQKGMRGLDLEKTKWSFEFLLPAEFQESITHQWGNYDSVASNLGQKFTSMARPAVEVASGIKNTWNSISKESVQKWVTEGFKASPISSVTGLLDIFGNSTQAGIFRFDTALVYQGSPRRQYTFQFPFADLGDGYKDIVYPIKLLEFLSCAEIEKGFGNIQTPYVFQLYTTPKKWINIKAAALTAVLPNFKGPYRGGFPSAADCQLTFIELYPLYRSQFEIEIAMNGDENYTAQPDSSVFTSEGGSVEATVSTPVEVSVHDYDQYTLDGSLSSE